MGDFAARSLPPTKDYVKLTVIPVNSTQSETINVPFISKFMSARFTSGSDLWNQNCKATAGTNGVDYFPNSGNSDGETQSGGIELVDPSPPKFAEPIAPQDRKHAISAIVDITLISDLDLPQILYPSGWISGDGPVQFYLQGKVGVMALGSFSTGLEYSNWFTTLKGGLDKLVHAGATHLIVDVSNNGGGYTCVAQFLHRYVRIFPLSLNVSFLSILIDI